MDWVSRELGSKRKSNPMKPTLLRTLALILTLAPAISSASTATPEPELVSVASPAKPGFSRELAFTVDPLSTVRDGRYGVKAELMLAPHHAFLAHPSASFFSSKTGETMKAARSDYSVELGYRYYLDGHGLDGLFLGPSVRYGQSHSDQTSVLSSGTMTMSNTDNASAAVAVDIGWKHSTRSGFTYGGGVGVQYATTIGASSQVGVAGSAFAPETRSNSLNPRVLCELGYVFDLH